MVMRFLLGVLLTLLVFLPILHVRLLLKRSPAEYRLGRMRGIKARFAEGETVVFGTEKKLPHYLIFALTLLICDLALVASPGNTLDALVQNPMFGLFAVLGVIAVVMPALAVTEYVYKGFVLTNRRFYWYGPGTLGRVRSVPIDGVRGVQQTLYGQVRLELLNETGRWTRLTLDPFPGHGVFVRAVRKANPDVRHIVHTLMGKKNMNKPPRY